MGISVDDIKKLRDLTGVGLTDAKKALEETDGDFDKALEEMRKKGLTRAEKKGDREARMGLVDSYVHDNRIGVVVEVNCETDFVARLPEFKEFAHQIVLEGSDFNQEILFVRLESMIHPLDEVKIIKYNNINAVALGIISKNQKSYTQAERHLQIY